MLVSERSARYPLAHALDQILDLSMHLTIAQPSAMEYIDVPADNSEVAFLLPRTGLPHCPQARKSEGRFVTSSRLRVDFPGACSMRLFTYRQNFLSAIAIAALGAAPEAWSEGNEASVVYRCPGTPVLYTDSLSAIKARQRNCRATEGAAITAIQGIKPRIASSGAPTASHSASRIDSADQGARDSDAKRILEAELRREEERLAAMKAGHNNGQFDRRGSELKNYQKYSDQVADIEAAIARKEGDVGALKRELAKYSR